MRQILRTGILLSGELDHPNSPTCWHACTMQAMIDTWDRGGGGRSAMGVEAREFHQEHRYLYWGPILFSGWWRKKKKLERIWASTQGTERDPWKKKHTQSYFWEKIIRKSHTCQRQRGRKIWLKTPVAEIAGAPKEWDSPGVAGDKSWLVWLAAWSDI